MTTANITTILNQLKEDKIGTFRIKSSFVPTSIKSYKQYTISLFYTIGTDVYKVAEKTYTDRVLQEQEDSFKSTSAEQFLVDIIKQEVWNLTNINQLQKI